MKKKTVSKIDEIYKTKKEPENEPENPTPKFVGQLLDNLLIFPNKKSG
ncbi:hypothetical protein Q5O14_04110 [Eubacteriaceae bacterium ES2]|nr:hypothetical protein Q5O14_04110 [Eubacteriaceae bacterium ES2]